MRSTLIAAVAAGLFVLAGCATYFEPLHVLTPSFSYVDGADSPPAPAASSGDAVASVPVP